MSRFGNALWLALALACGSALAADEIRWAPDIPTARKAAAQFNVPLLIHFYGDNCLPCKTLETRVFAKPELVETLNKYFICVKVNASQERQTAAQYQVHSWPTDVFLSPDGKTLYQGVCSQNFNTYLSTLQNVAVMNRDRNVLLAAQANPTPAPGQNQSPAVGSQGASSTTTVAGNSLIGTPMGTPAARGSTNSYSGTAPQTALASLTTSTAPGLVQPPTSPTANSAIPANNYAANNSQMPPLPAGFPTNANVARGPVGAPQQPQAIQAATPSQQGLLAGPTNPRIMASPTDQLPPRDQTARVTEKASPRSGQIPASARMQSMPTLAQPPFSASKNPNPTPAQTASFQAGQPSAGQHPTQPQRPANSYTSAPVQAQLVSNPHFVQPDATQGIPDESLVAPKPADPPKTPEPQPTFQPRTQPQISPTNATPATQPDTPAIEGYCPVALRHGAKWVAGDAKFAVKHRGKTYWMSSQEAMQQFLQNPDDSSPVLSGFDPYVFLEEGKLVEGSVQYGLLERTSGTFLLFSSEDAKQKYWKDFDRYSMALDALLTKAGAK